MGRSGDRLLSAKFCSVPPQTPIRAVVGADLRDRFTHTPDGEPGLNYLCPSFKLFFHHVQEPMRTMAELLAADRAPAEIMDHYAASDARRGRNDPCTCGSGRKWKHCHGDPSPAPAPPARNDPPADEPPYRL
jgi:hypothetical protein